MAKVRFSPGITQRTVTCDGQLVGRIAGCGSAGVRELAAGDPARATVSMPHQCRASSINAAIDVVDAPHRATPGHGGLTSGPSRASPAPPAGRSPHKSRTLS
jgi:hypothetical protein